MTLGDWAVVKRVPDRSVVSCLLATLALLDATPVAGQGGRMLADWQRDLRDSSPTIRAGAAQALAAFDQRAVPALTGALGDSEYKVRVSAAEALVKIGPAAVVLGAFGPPAKPAVPALARALKDANPRVRELAGQALDRIGSTWPSQPVTFPLNCH
jgi:HEAT repeat protein